MNEERAAFRPLDDGRIHVADAREVEYWCRELGCSEASLRRAVAEAGEHVTAVREHLAHA